MMQTDLKAFALLMAKLETAFSEVATKERIAVYFEQLSDLSIEQVRSAVNFILNTREWKGFPTIGEIKSATLGSMRDKATYAWGELIRQRYHLKSVFEDPLIPEVTRVAFGTIDDFYGAENRNEASDRKHFIETYVLVANLKEVNKEKKRLPEGQSGELMRR